MIKAIVSMLCITAIIITALLIGQNGLVLASGIGALAGLGGFFAGRKLPGK
ncbi:hypothetical protein ES703_103393 [subsurface metagenome]